MMNAFRAAAVAAALAVASAAHAFEPTGLPVADAFLAIAAAPERTTVAVDAAREEDGAVVLDGFLATTVRDNGTVVLGVERIRLEDGEVTPEGGLQAETIRLSELAISRPDEAPEVSVGEIEASGVELAAPARVADGVVPADGFLYRSVRLSAITLAPEGGAAIPIEDVRLRARPETADGAQAASVSVTGLRIPPELFEDDGLAAQLAMLGYDGITLDFDGEGVWRSGTGDLSLDRLEIEAAGMGVLDLSAELRGLTRPVLDQLSSDEAPTDAEAMALLNEVALERATLTYRDRGLVSKILGVMASNQGKTRDEVAGEIASLMPMLLAGIEADAFTRELSAAMGAFLRQPGTLTVNAEPDAPLPASQVIGTAMIAPNQIPTVLGLTVEANR